MKKYDFNKLPRACDGHAVQNCDENCYIMALEQEITRLHGLDLLGAAEQALQEIREATDNICGCNSTPPLCAKCRLEDAIANARV